MAKKNPNIIPSKFKTVTQYEDEFVKVWKENTAKAVAEVVKYIATTTADAIKDKK